MTAGTGPAPAFDDPGRRDELGRVVLDALPPDVVAANRAAWVAALRSGGYAQARQVLRTGDPDAPRAAHGFCCLGVVEDLGRGGTGWSHTRNEDYDDTDDTDEYDDDERSGWSVPDPRVLVRFPSPVTVDGDATEVIAFGGGSATRQLTELTGRACRWLGLATPNPVVTLRNRHDRRWVTQSLVNLNDEWHLTFGEIATVIEDQPTEWDGTTTFALGEAGRRTAVDAATDDAEKPA